MDESRDMSVSSVDTVDECSNAAANDNAVLRGNRKPSPAVEVGGRGGPDPTRYGDWEKAGRCIDF